MTLKTKKTTTKKPKVYKYNKPKPTIDPKILKEIQDIMGPLGFILDGDNTYYKLYTNKNNATIELRPSFDSDNKLIGMSVATLTKLMLFKDGESIPLEQFPRECLSDVANVAIRLAPNARIPPKETFIVSMDCANCGENGHSYVTIKGRTTCLDCAQITN